MATKKIDIVPDGDVYLICGNGSSVKIRVASASLIRGSDAFKAMLGPHFKEGRQLASKVGTIEIELEDDDPEAMTMLCRALHSQFVSMPKELNAASLMNLSIVADKHLCTGSLRFPSEVWINKEMQKTGPLDRVSLLVAAYLFQQPELVNAVSLDLLLKSEEHLNKTKRTFEAEFALFMESDILNRLSMNATYCKNGCLYSIVQAATLQKRLNTLRVWPVSKLLCGRSTMSLDKLLAASHSLDTTPTTTTPCKPSCCGIGVYAVDKDHLTFEGAKRKYSNKATEMERRLSPLSYLCVRAGGG
ncbi:hypothetical protein LTR56_007734 [Elasticomyces elasticus]|nr:hypothetical protein LTR56_007734 [Elasticomyces elasticus]KAK4925593.1 hypothetical protein LTR49_007431 [Elasticomyces elasticus]KAK5759871.1 hypothetical protein LTS12_010058 [Elasticomyces elasticus]